MTSVRNKIILEGLTLNVGSNGMDFYAGEVARCKKKNMEKESCSHLKG
jgi:hypothetical protein